MKTAYIICVNDSTEAVVIDDMKKALREMDRLKKEHQKKISPCKEYENVYFWHLHDVPVIEDKVLGQPYLKDDHKWYLDLPSHGTYGPYSTYSEATKKWDEFLEWCSEMDVN